MFWYSGNKCVLLHQTLKRFPEKIVEPFGDAYLNQFKALGCLDWGLPLPLLRADGRLQNATLRDRVGTGRGW